MASQLSAKPPNEQNAAESTVDRMARMGKLNACIAWGRSKPDAGIRGRGQAGRAHCTGTLKMGWGVGSDGGVFSPNGSLAFNPVAMQIRQVFDEAHVQSRCCV